MYIDTMDILELLTLAFKVRYVLTARLADHMRKK